jgi:hypothetical protein
MARTGQTTVVSQHLLMDQTNQMEAGQLHPMDLMTRTIAGQLHPIRPMGLMGQIKRDQLHLTERMVPTETGWPHKTAPITDPITADQLHPMEQMIQMALTEENKVRPMEPIMELTTKGQLHPTDQMLMVLMVGDQLHPKMGITKLIMEDQPHPIKTTLNLQMTRFQLFD